MRVPPQLPSRTPCKIAFVGEAPSDEEVLDRQPFVGPAGRVFNACLRAANLEREEFLITNVFDEKAPNNDVTEWMKDEGRVKEAFERLQQEIEASNPDVIVPLGGTALWAFTGEKKITNFRGAVLAARRLVTGAKLVPTYHPAAVIRDWRLLPTVTGDFVKAAAEAALGPKIIYPKVELLIEPDIQDVESFAQECFASRKLSVDIETGWGQITAIAFAPTPSRAMSIPFVDLRQPDRSYWRSAEDEFNAWRIVQEICEAPNPKVGQNFLYDISWLYKKHGIAVRNYRYDTRLRHKVLWPELPASLGQMAASYTRLGSWKHWGHRAAKEKTDG